MSGIEHNLSPILNPILNLIFNQIFNPILKTIFNPILNPIMTAAAGSAEVVIMLKSCVFVGLFVARFRHFYKKSFPGISNI